MPISNKNSLTWTLCLRRNRSIMSNSIIIRFPSNNCSRQAKPSLNDQVYFISRSRMSKREWIREETVITISEVRKAPERMQIISLLQLLRRCTWKINSKLTTVRPALVEPSKTAAKSRSFPFGPRSSTSQKHSLTIIKSSSTPPNSNNRETPMRASTEILQKVRITCS